MLGKSSIGAVTRTVNLTATQEFMGSEVFGGRCRLAAVRRVTELFEMLAGPKPAMSLSPVNSGLRSGVGFADVATNFMNQFSR